jgi:hypothetical protein
MDVAVCDLFHRYSELSAVFDETRDRFSLPEAA